MKRELKPVTRENFTACVDFLAPREFRCVTLTSQLCVDGKPSKSPEKLKNLMCLCVTDDTGTLSRVDGVVYRTPTGILLHCLDEEADLAPYEKALEEWLSTVTVYSIIGTRSGSLYLEDRIPRTYDRAIDYQLMAVDTLPTEAQCRIEGLTIERASEKNAEELLPLQESYEREEVVPPGNTFNREACLANLALNLRKQHIYLLRENGVCIAKAGTNAQGLRWDQIGGVYTEVPWRGRGIASAMVAHIARERMTKGRKIVLFVKTANLFAQKAYKNAGFLPEILFRITYYPL